MIAGLMAAAILVEATILGGSTRNVMGALANTTANATAPGTAPSHSSGT